MTFGTSPLASAMAGEAPEVSISRDLVKKGLWIAPVVVGLGAIFGGADGAWSAAFSLGLILVNFDAAAIDCVAGTKPMLGVGGKLTGELGYADIVCWWSQQ